MQYWKNFKNGMLERLEESEIKKHPEKIESLKFQGFERINSEFDESPYKKKIKRRIKKKK